MLNTIKLCAIGALITLGISCSKTPELDVSAASKKQIIATHAFDLNAPITALSFTPNDVAPWLGRVIYIDKAGKLFSTDIEGRDPKPVGTGSYLDVFGLMQIKLPGVFLALNRKDGSLNAFIESDNEGRFSAMSTSTSSSISAQTFCQTMRPQEDKALLLTNEGTIVTLDISVVDQVAEIKNSGQVKAPKDTKICVFDDDTTYALSSHKGVHRLHAYKDKKWESQDLDFTPNSFASVTVGGTPSLAILGEKGVLLMDGQDMSAQYALSVADGLSIRGVASADFVSATSAPFGGAAFSEGVIVLSDKSTPRLVFISLGYMGDRLSAVQ